MEPDRNGNGKKGADRSGNQLFVNSVRRWEGWSMTMKRETTMTKTKRTIMKRVLAFALCFILTLAAFSLACNPALADVKPTCLGDANCDSEVNQEDISLIRDYLLGIHTMTDTGRANADLNKNHIVDIHDAVQIQKWY